MKSRHNQRIISNSIVFQPIVGVDNKRNPVVVDLSLRPVQRLNCVTNIATYKYNHYTANQVTLAREQHLTLKLNLDENTNFIKDFYLDKNKTQNLDVLSTTFNEKLVTAYLKTARTSYDFANTISQQFVTEQLIINERLKSGKQSVRKRLVKTLKSMSQKKSEKKLQWQIELRRLYHQMREAVQHILDAHGEAKFSQLNELIELKKHVTEEFIQGLPKKNKNEIQTYLQDVRLLLSKKTDELVILKELHGKDFVYDDKTLRELSESGRSGDDTGSLLSQQLITSRSQSQKKIQREDERKISKYFDVQKLKEKFNLNSEEKIKSLIRRTIVKETMMEAEHIKSIAYKEELIRTGKFGQPNPIIKPTRAKTRREVILERAKSEKKAGRANERTSLMGPDLKKSRDREIQNVAANTFFENYNAAHTFGECFDAASKYSKLFF